ncbi:MAG: helix-turn-helix transcriptional regulator, partial [Kordiimonadaceae bacterium]|nr:helix-turn-helix transcriptional regulator [Kordiimonadaceae bacterium]
MSYIEQINRAIDHIESNLLDALTIADTAKEAGLSYWHFQRIFAATVGDTVTDYICSRRLSHAALRLVTSNDRVIDIALG